MKKNKLMKRTIKFTAMAAVAAMMMVGCNKQENSTEVTSPEITEETSTEIEPTQTEEAKKLPQFKELKKGDTVAELTIQGYGTLTFKLFPKYAPKAVENFTTLSKEGYYDGVTFHRIIDDFMIQGGDPNGTGSGGNSIWGTPFEDEFSDDLHPYRGALCMANSGANTNGSQFFIVDADAASVAELSNLLEERYKGELSFLDYLVEGYGVTLTQEELDGYFNYGGTPWLEEHHTVFGQLMEGFDVLDAVAGAKVSGTTPVEAVVIEQIKIYEYDGK